MNKKVLLSLGVLGVIGFAGLGIYNHAFAYQGDYTKQGPNCTQEQHTAIENAINNNDYNAWKELMQGKGRVTQVINETNFSKFAEAYKFSQEGKTSEADAIRKDLGLRTSDGQRSGNGSGQGRGMGCGRMAK